jgi:hypothetical protein
MTCDLQLGAELLLPCCMAAGFSPGRRALIINAMWFMLMLPSNWDICIHKIAANTNSQPAAVRRFQYLIFHNYNLLIFF